MKDSKNKVLKLLEQGKLFSYANFSSKGDYGYPIAFTPEWTAWTARVKSAIKSLLGSNSASMDLLKSALGIRLIGYGNDKFDLAKSYYLGALESTKEVLEEDVFHELLNSDAIAPGNFNNEIFIVHGHDDKSKNELDIILKEMGLNPIILHRQADQGQTVIEKFEKHSNVGFAFILLTPDEVSYLSSQEKEDDNKRIKEYRARPNVIFEFGYFVGKLTRKRVCCLYTGNVRLPSDINGLLYKKFNNSIEEVAYSISKELKASGYSLK